MKRCRAAILILVLLPMLGGMPSPATGKQEASPVASDERSGPVRLVAQLTGADSGNATDTRFGIAGTDLGHTFEHRGEIVMVFGDTFGEARGDWRSNTAGMIGDDDPRDGLTLERMVEDRPGHAKELLSSKKVAGDEITVIPTYGVSVGSRMFLHYMSVREWGPPGQWSLNASGLAFSDDDGQTWIKDPAATWGDDSNFGQVAIVSLDGYAYYFGIPGGRFGGVRLARVGEEKLLDLNAYEYWAGDAWRQGAEETAKTIVPSPVGELSVRWNAYYRKWLMMYLDEDKAAIVLRTADCLTGPWGDEQTVVTADDYPQLYAPYLLPRWNGRPEVYFTMSLFGPYNVYLMEARLTGITASTAEPECIAPS